MAYRYLPAQSEAGGDRFDVILLPGARVALVAGDVVGHGRLRNALDQAVDKLPACPEETCVAMLGTMLADRQNDDIALLMAGTHGLLPDQIADRDAPCDPAVVAKAGKVIWTEQRLPSGPLEAIPCATASSRHLRQREWDLARLPASWTTGRDSSMWHNDSEHSAAAVATPGNRQESRKDGIGEARKNSAKK